MKSSDRMSSDSKPMSRWAVRSVFRACFFPYIIIICDAYLNAWILALNVMTTSASLWKIHDGKSWLSSTSILRHVSPGCKYGANSGLANFCLTAPSMQACEPQTHESEHICLGIRVEGNRKCQASTSCCSHGCRPCQSGHS